MALKTEGKRSKRIQILKKCISCVYRLLCFVGLLVQVVSITKTYLTYEIATKLTIGVDHILRIPDYTICTTFVPLLDAKWVRDVKKLDVGRDFLNVSRVVTVQEILEKTPAPSHLLTSCMTRSKDTYGVNFHLKNQCLQHFNITKSVFKEFVCYTLKIKTNSSIDLKKITFSRRLSRVVFIFNLDSSFNAVMSLKPMVHITGSLPYTTSSFSMEHSRKVYGQPNSTPNFNTIKTSYTKYVISRLPPPFASRCRSYKESDDVLGNTRDDCIQTCLKGTTPKALGKVPFTSFIQQPIDMKQISMEDLKIRNISYILNKLEHACQSQCSQLDCFLTFTVTSGTTEIDVKMRLLVYSPNSPDLVVQEEEAFKFLDFLIFIASCVGSWLGLSFLSFDPIDLYEIIFSYTRKDKVSEVTTSSLCRRKSIFPESRTSHNFNVKSELESYREYNRRLLSYLETTRKKEMNELRQEMKSFRIQFQH